MKINRIIIHPSGTVIVEINVPKILRGTNYRGEKYKAKVQNLYRLTITQSIYSQAHCIREGWHSYPDKNYIKIIYLTNNFFNSALFYQIFVSIFNLNLLIK